MVSNILAAVDPNPPVAVVPSLAVAALSEVVGIRSSDSVVVGHSEVASGYPGTAVVL